MMLPQIIKASMIGSVYDTRIIILIEYHFWLMTAGTVLVVIRGANEVTARTVPIVIQIKSDQMHQNRNRLLLRKPVWALHILLLLLQPVSQLSTRPQSSYNSHLS